MANEKTLELEHLSKAFEIYDASLAGVAVSGDYNDLANKPDIPVLPTLAAVATSGAYSDLSGKPDLATVATSGAYSDLSGAPTLAAVATSGSYNDLTDTPTIGDVYTYKGSVANYAALPASATTGDVYNTEDTGMNYAWNGTAWDALGGTFEIEYATTAEVTEAIEEVIAARG